jgi:hypothetical protein
VAVGGALWALGGVAVAAWWRRTGSLKKYPFNANSPYNVQVVWPQP